MKPRLFYPPFWLVLLMLLACSDSHLNLGGSDSASTDGSYTWFESGFGICSKPCGLGMQAQDVYCLRLSDGVPVADSYCHEAKPAGTRNCNAEICSALHKWNVGPFGSCSRACGGGVRERQVLCQDQSGTPVKDEFCAAVAKPVDREACNLARCLGPPKYKWQIDSGKCSKLCGEGMATDQVSCIRSDGAPVDDKFCEPARKPPAAHLCNIIPCDDNPAYQWQSGEWSKCSAPCGDGVQTRSVVCAREDGAFVAESLCEATVRPSAHQVCNLKSCSAGRKVTQIGVIPSSVRSVDILLIIDDSSNMKSDQMKFARFLPTLLDDLETQNIDYQVCLTTTDAEYFKGSPLLWPETGSPLLTAKTPFKNQVIETAITNLADGWSADERALKATHLLLRDFKNSGCVRDNTTIVGIVLSDEDERSVGGRREWSETQYKPLEFEDDPENLLALLKDVKFIWNSLIVRPSDSKCLARQDAQGTPAFYGSTYASLSNKTHGLIGDICEDSYGSFFRQVSERIVSDLPGFPLECVPLDAPTLTVERRQPSSVYMLEDRLKIFPAPATNARVTAVYTCPARSP